MSTPLLMTACMAIALAGAALGGHRARKLVALDNRAVRSRPPYHASYVALCSAVPAGLILGVWLFAEPALVQMLTQRLVRETFPGLGPDQVRIRFLEVVNIARGVLPLDPGNRALGEVVEQYRGYRSVANGLLAFLSIGAAILGVAIGFRRVHPGLAARQGVERVLEAFLLASAFLAVLTTIGIVLALLFESLRFFERVPFTEFLFGTHWSPQMAIREDQVGSSGSFGAVPLFSGTMLIALIAMLVATPVGLLSAIYLSEYATPRIRRIVKPVLEILAGIPTVVYGFFAALTVAPFVAGVGSAMGLSVSTESALAAGLVMGIMIIPFVSSLSDDVINAVPQALRDASLALGATESETITKVILPAALPGVAGALLLAVSRAIGETMIVVMAAGLAAALTANPLESVTTVTAQIVAILVGDQEFDSAKTLSAFALGLVLFTVTLILNVLALHIVKKYRERYE